MSDWRTIASAHLDGDATPDERAELEGWLSEEPTHGDDYVLWLEIHEALRAHYGEAQIRTRATPAINDAFLQPTRRRSAGFSAAWSLATAATLLIGLWSAGLLKTRVGPAEADVVAADAPASPRIEEVAATLTGAVDCRWELGSDEIEYGERIAPGTVLRLSEGLAQLTYETGPKVVIRGPCEFRVEGPSQGVLPIGQLTAIVPRRGVGFVVQTPCAEIVDLGTEFAVDVDEFGVSEVHVFKGEVVSRRRARGEDPTSEDLHLVTHQAARYSPVETSIPEFRADDTRFIREITPRLVESELPRAPQKRGLALWMAADLLVKTDEANGVYAWNDVLCGDNKAEDHALQPNPWERPTLVEGALNGANAIRFDGESSHLVTTPMVTGPSQTVFLVTRVPAHQPNHHPGTLLNYNGPVHRDMTAPAERGVLQIGLGARKQSSRPLEAFVYVGASARSGQVHSTPILESDTAVMTYRYNVYANRAAMYVNGVLVDSSSAPAPASSSSRRVFGRHGHLPHYFAGDLGEVLIYDRALKPKELAEITSYLGQKYGVAIDDSASTDKL